MEGDASVAVKVCYALPHHQEIITLRLARRITVLEAIQQSGILDNYREIDLSKNGIGIYGRLVELHQIVRDQDRIEIYRALSLHPMAARRRRAMQE